MLNALLPNKQYHEIIENYNSCLMKPFNSIIKEPLDGYLRKSFSWHLFHLIFGFSTKSLHVKNYLWGNGTGEFDQPRRGNYRQKWETTSLKSKPKLKRAAHDLMADFVAVISILTFSHSMKMSDRCLINSDRRNFDFVQYTYGESRRWTYLHKFSLWILVGSCRRNHPQIQSMHPCFYKG